MRAQNGHPLGEGPCESLSRAWVRACRSQGPGTVTVGVKEQCGHCGKGLVASQTVLHRVNRRPSNSIPRCVYIYP